MPRKASRLAVAALIAASLVSEAGAHVAPALGDNNRYLKLTPLGDRVRLAYTVFYGEVPGKALRQVIDANHDGAIDDAESEAFAGRIAHEVSAAIVLSVDSAVQPVSWSQVVVGFGTPRADGGAFSIDLVAWLCLAVPGGKHTVVLRDDFKLDRPGETEVAVEASPGVTIDQSHIDGAVDEAHDYKLVGPSGALATDGLDLVFTAGPKAVVTSDAICRRPAGFGSTALAGALVLGGLAVGATIVVVVRRRRQAARSMHRS